MRPSIRITGTKEIQRKLQRLGKISERRVIEAALIAGGEVIADEARRLVPEKTGNLRDSIAVSTDALNYSRGTLRKGAAEVFVGPTQGRGADHDGFYGHMVEFGTMHASPRPFMRPAFDTKGEDAAASVIDHLRRSFDKATKG